MAGRSTHKGLEKPIFSRRLLVIFGLVFAALGGLLIYSTWAAPNPNLPGDLNNDNVVNVQDMSILSSNYGTTNPASDINGDGTVNILDLSILLTHYGQSVSVSGSSIYWGGLLDGDQTYSYYYGDPAPNGQPWGDAPWGNTGNTWDRFESNAGKKVSIIHYGQPVPWLQTTFYNGLADIATSRGAFDLMDMGQDTTGTLQSMVNGSYDSSIQTWAASVKAWGKPIFLRPWWEMNGNWFGWGKDAAANPSLYVSAWRHWHDVVVNAGATNVTWVWCPNTEYSGSTPLSQLYPGDTYVDWTCIDGYNPAGFNGTAWTSFYNLFHQTYADILAIAPNKPMMIGETSSSELGGNKAAWISDALGTQLPTNFPKMRALVWFNWRISQNNTWQDWPIESSAAATSAFKTGIGSTYYKAGSSSLVSVPSLSKVPVP